MALAFFTAPAPLPESSPLTEADAVDIWIARWLRIRRSDLVRRYDCDPRRLYEIWEEVRFAGTRDKALEVFAARYPSLGAASKGRSIEKVVPSSTSGSTEMLPPCRSMIPWESESPSPVPFPTGFVVKKGSNSLL